MLCWILQGLDDHLVSVCTPLIPYKGYNNLEREVGGILESLTTWRREGDNLILVHGCGEEKLTWLDGGAQTEDLDMPDFITMKSFTSVISGDEPFEKIFKQGGKS